MAASLIAQALIQEVAPRTIENHVKARDFLRQQEEADASSLLCSLVDIYQACSGTSHVVVDATLDSTLKTELVNEYQVGQSEVRLLCLIALRAIWQRNSRNLDMSRCGSCLVFLIQRLRECLYNTAKSPESEQIISTVTQISRSLIPFEWSDLLNLILQGLTEMYKADGQSTQMQTKEFLAMLLQFFQVHISRKVGSAQADFLVIFQRTTLVPLLFALWGKYHDRWMKAHVIDSEEDPNEFYLINERRHATQAGEMLNDEMMCLDSILMIVITHFNKMELLMSGELAFDQSVYSAIAEFSATPSTFIQESISNFSTKVNLLLRHMQVWATGRHIAILARMLSTVTQRYAYFIPGKSQIHFSLQESILAPFQSSVMPVQDGDWGDGGFGNVLLPEILLRLGVMNIVLTTPRYGWTSKYKSSREIFVNTDESVTDALELEKIWGAICEMDLLHKIYQYLLSPGLINQRNANPTWENLRVSDWLEFCSDFTEVLEGLGTPQDIGDSFIKGFLSRHSFVSVFFPKALASYREHVEAGMKTDDPNMSRNPKGAFFLVKLLQVLAEERWELMAIFRSGENEMNKEDSLSVTGGIAEPPTPQSDLESRQQLRYCLNELMLLQMHYWDAVDLEESSNKFLWYQNLEVTAALSEVATATYHTDWLEKLEGVTNALMAKWADAEKCLQDAGYSPCRRRRSEASLSLSNLCVRHLTRNFREALMAIAKCRQELGYLKTLNVQDYRGDPDIDEAVWQSLSYLSLEYQSRVDWTQFTEAQYQEYLKLIISDATLLTQHVSSTWGQKFYSSTTLLCGLWCLVDPVLTIADEVRALWNPVIKICGMLMNMLDIGYGNRIRKSGDVKFNIPPCSYDASPPVEKTHYQFPSANVSPYLFGTDMETTSLCLLGVRLLIHAVGILGGHRGASAYGAEIPVIELHQSMMVKLDATYSEIVIDQMSPSGNKLRPSMLLRAVTDLWLEIVLWIQTNIPKGKSVDILHHWREDLILRFLNLLVTYFDSANPLATAVAADKADICHRMWRLSHAAIWPPSCQALIKDIFESQPITHLLMHKELGLDTTHLFEKYSGEELRTELRRVPLGLRAEYRRLVDASVDLSRDLERYQEAAQGPFPPMKKENNVAIVLSMNNDYMIEIEDEDLSATVPVSNLHSIYHELEKLGLK